MSTMITRENAASFRRPLFRPDPVLPVQSMKTYSVVTRPDREVVTACAEAGCLAWRYGWETAVDESTALGRRQAEFIRLRAGRSFRELRRGELTMFRFDARQRCFAEHRTRPTIFAVRPGDWRGYFGRPQVFDRPDQWVDSMQTGLDQVRTRKERG